jgi:hypothetical protein
MVCVELFRAKSWRIGVGFFLAMVGELQFFLDLWWYCGGCAEKVLADMLG